MKKFREKISDKFNRISKGIKDLFLIDKYDVFAFVSIWLICKSIVNISLFHLPLTYNLGIAFVLCGLLFVIIYYIL